MTQSINALKLEQKHADDYEASISIPVTVNEPLDVEIDSTDTGFDTELYRVWYGHSILGTFKSSYEDDCQRQSDSEAGESTIVIGWLAFPFYNNQSAKRISCATSTEARDAIVKAYQASKGLM